MKKRFKRFSLDILVHRQKYHHLSYQPEILFQPSWVFNTGDKDWEFKVSELTQGERTEMG